MGRPPAHAFRSLDNASVEDRVRAIVEAGIAVTSELSLDAVLEKLTATAASLTDARYAALGVLDEPKTGLERFITVGVDEETRAAIGPEPRGRGILGVLIREAQPLRLHDLTDDPRSVGFPPNHPPMRSFLGVPIVLRGVAYGNLYLTEKPDGGDFTEEDEELVTMLATQAAVAIENARLFESATRWLRQLESLNEVGNALVGEFELDRLLALVTDRLRALVGARLVFIALPAGHDRLRIAAADGAEADELLATTFSREESKAGRVLDRRQGERVDDLASRSGGGSRHRGLVRSDNGALHPARRARPGDRGARRARQARLATSGSPTTTCASPRPSRRARPWPSTSPSGSRATRCGASSRPRSSSAAGSRGSSTTRPARRSRRSCWG